MFIMRSLRIKSPQGGEIMGIIFFLFVAGLAIAIIATILKAKYNDKRG